MWVVEIGGRLIQVRGRYIERYDWVEIGTAYEVTQDGLDRLIERFEFERVPEDEL